MLLECVSVVAQSPYALCATQGPARAAADGGLKCDGRRSVCHREAHVRQQGSEPNHHPLLGWGGVRRRVRGGDALGMRYYYLL